MFVKEAFAVAQLDKKNLASYILDLLIIGAER